MVKNPKLEDIKEVCNIARERVALGELRYQSFVNFVSNLSTSELAKVRYHSECRKPIVNKTNLERLRKRARSESSVTAGRPPSTSDVVRPKRVKTMHKEPVCIFNPCSFCPVSLNDPLHCVSTDGRGQSLLQIKYNTTDNAVRACVSDLQDMGDAAALEKYYHSCCLCVAQRTCPQVSNTNESIIRKLCDTQLIMSVRSSLSVEGTILNMNQINNEYVSLLKEHDLTFGWHHKKYLKELIVKNIPDVEFVKSVCPNEAEQVTLASSVRQAVSHYSTQDQDDRILAALLDVSLALRREILEKVPWKFTGELGSYENPPMLQVFLKHLLFGQSTIVGER